MKIDLSRANAFRTCPMMYYEKYERGGNGIEPIPKGEDYGLLDLGGRVHELLECYYKGLKGDPIPEYPAHPVEKCELEAQWMVEAYLAHYPQDNWRIVDVERTFEVPLPGLCRETYLDWYDHDRGCEWCDKHMPIEHSLIGKIDLIIQDSEGAYYIVDHKTQKRSAKSNHPSKWKMRDQASLYLFACDQIYKDFQVSNFLVNVLVRPSDKGMVPPTFLDRQKLERSEDQITTSVRDMVYIADSIERMRTQFPSGNWLMNRENCFDWTDCAFSLLHTFGEDTSLILKHKFQPRKEYLNLAEVS